MSFLGQTAAIFVVTIKRLNAQYGIALAMLAGIFTAEALTMSIPMYADAAYQKILVNEIEEMISETDVTVKRPPFSIMFRYLGAWYKPVGIEKLKPVDQYLSSQIEADLGLPTQVFVRYLKADIFGLYPYQNALYEDTNKLLERVNISSLSGLEDHIFLVEGDWPINEPSATLSTVNSPVDVLVHETLANQLGLHIGEVLSARTQIGDAKSTVVVLVKISGVWREKDTLDHYWYYGINAVSKDLLTPEPILLNCVAPTLNNQINEVIWYRVLDGSSIQSSQVSQLLAKIQRAREIASRLLPKTTLEISPIGILTEYQKSAQSLAIYLVVFSLPLFFMILVFINLVEDMIITRRKNEIATLRSRGVTVTQLIGMSIIESTILGITGMAVAAVCSRYLVIFFSKADSFLHFSSSTTMQTQINQTGLRLGLVTLGVTVIAQIIPTIGASRYLITSYKKEVSRQLVKPWWQRAWLDFLLLIPSAYGIYIIKHQSNLFGIGGGANPFQNPLLLLLPVLVILSLTLLIVRCLPYCLRIIAWIFCRASSVSILLAARFLSRKTGDYNAPLILLVLTLSLSTFTASMAQTLDRYDYDQTYYRVGADVQLIETGSKNQENQWEFLPVSEHLQIPGVQAAARVRKVNVSLIDSNGSKAVYYYGIDRFDFQQVAFWRSDFSPQPLGALMNQMAATPEGVIVSRNLLEQYHYQIGDFIWVKAFESGKPYEIEFRIVGIVDYFPTWYPEGSPLLVGNLDYYSERIGYSLPYNVWLKTDPDMDSEGLVHEINKIFKSVLDYESAPKIISEQQSLPERQGIFGLLSIGYIGLSILSALGFLLYSLFSFHRRTIEFGMLRAIGLSTRQMLAILLCELAFLFLAGLASGTGLGVWISNMIIPHLQAGTALIHQAPPFLIQINWPSVFQTYALFVFLYIVAIVVLMILLIRLKIFQAIKLGETV